MKPLLSWPFITVKCIFVLDLTIDWKIHQMDVKMAYLNGMLKVEIYMDQPNDSKQEGGKFLVCKFKNVFYSLKQSQRVWSTILTRISILYRS